MSNKVKDIGIAHNTFLMLVCDNKRFEIYKN